MAMKMLNGFVLLKNVVRQENGELSDGGVYIGEDKERKYPAVATVQATCPVMETGVEDGMQVVYMDGAASKFMLDGKEYYMIGEKSLMGYIDE